MLLLDKIKIIIIRRRNYEIVWWLFSCSIIFQSILFLLYNCNVQMIEWWKHILFISFIALQLYCIGDGPDKMANKCSCYEVVTECVIGCYIVNPKSYSYDKLHRFWSKPEWQRVDSRQSRWCERGQLPDRWAPAHSHRRHTPVASPLLKWIHINQPAVFLYWYHLCTKLTTVLISHRFWAVFFIPGVLSILLIFL